MDFVLRRSDLLDAERDEQHREHDAEPALAAREVSREIPAEENENKEAEAENECGRHR